MIFWPMILSGLLHSNMLSDFRYYVISLEAFWLTAFRTSVLAVAYQFLSYICQTLSLLAAGNYYENICKFVHSFELFNYQIEH